MSSRIIHPGSVSLLAGIRLRPARAYFFCDESGCSGDNYLDDSPLHVLAGYLVGESWWPRLKSLVENVKVRRGGGELKAADLLGTKGGRRLLANFIVEMDRLFLPVLVVVDKRHYGHIQLSRLLLDPRFNPRARDLQMKDGGGDEIERAFSAISDETLRCYIHARRAATSEGLAYTLNGAVRDLERRGWHTLSRRMLGIRPTLRTVAMALQNELAIWDVVGTKGNVFRVGTTIDLDAFLFCVDALNGMIGYLKQAHKDVQQVEVICDVQQGGAAFARLFAGFKQAGRLKHLGSFNTGDSANNLGLQAADFLAGSIRYVFGRPTVAREFGEAADALIFGFFSSPPKGRCFVPKEEHQRLAILSSDFRRRRRRVREQLVSLLSTAILAGAFARVSHAGDDVPTISET